ncbi:MAG: TetR family transcriptional regulator [Ruminococcaceae bacterium]|nr:TetR family transcriptional regulator [Oscillospiraceae bacterium]
MSEDKRILKTKKNLKNTLLELLDEKSFEQITVKEICERSATSRITFYTHFADKYELLDSIFQEYLASARNQYAELQKKNNPDSDPVKSFCNLLESVLDLCLCTIPFLNNTFPSDGSYINTSFYHYLYKYVEHRVEREGRFLTYKFSVSRISSFITYGFWGFVTKCKEESAPIEEIKKQTKELLISLLENNVIADN